MSYILDALRKADSERERGAVPGIHAQPVAVASDDAPASNWVVWRPWLIVAAFVALLAAVAWLVLERDAAPNPPSVPTAAPAAQTTVAPSVPAVPVVPPASTAAIAVTPAPASTAAAPPVLTGPASATPAPTPAARKPPPVAARKAVPNAPASAASGSARSEPKGEPVPAAASAGGRIYLLNELPEEVRRELPPLPIGGSIYSKTPSARLLIINGQLFHENDELAPGLVLEQIKLKAAVLRFKGYRYEVGF